MLLADFSAIDVLWICLSIFLVLVGVSLAVMLLRLGGTAQRLTSLLGGVEDKALPMIEEVNGTVERVNEQLDKADVVTTSAVDAVSAVDRSVRAVAGAVTYPVRKLSSFTTGVRHGSASLRTEQDVSRAYEAGREAARRRASDIDEELENLDSSSGSTEPAAGTSSASAWMQAAEQPGATGASVESADPPRFESDTGERRSGGPES